MKYIAFPEGDAYSQKSAAYSQYSKKESETQKAQSCDLVFYKFIDMKTSLNNILTQGIQDFPQSGHLTLVLIVSTLLLFRRVVLRETDQEDDLHLEWIR